jgi:hypothetical protein
VVSCSAVCAVVSCSAVPQFPFLVGWGCCSNTGLS